MCLQNQFVEKTKQIALKCCDCDLKLLPAFNKNSQTDYKEMLK